MIKQDVPSKVPKGVGLYWRVTRKLEVTFTLCHQTLCFRTQSNYQERQERQHL